MPTNEIFPVHACLRTPIVHPVVAAEISVALPHMYILERLINIVSEANKRRSASADNSYNGTLCRISFLIA